MQVYRACGPNREIRLHICVTHSISRRVKVSLEPTEGEPRRGLFRGRFLRGSSFPEAKFHAAQIFLERSDCIIRNVVGRRNEAAGGHGSD